MEEYSAEGEFELDEDMYEALMNSVVELVATVDLMKWNVDTLKVAYRFLASLIGELQRLRLGRYQILLYVKSKVRKTSKLKATRIDYDNLHG